MKGRRLSPRKAVKSWRHAVNNGGKRRIKMQRGGIRL